MGRAWSGLQGPLPTCKLLFVVHQHLAEEGQPLCQAVLQEAGLSWGWRGSGLKIKKWFLTEFFVAMQRRGAGGAGDCWLALSFFKRRTDWQTFNLLLLCSNVPHQGLGLGQGQSQKLGIQRRSSPLELVTCFLRRKLKLESRVGHGAPGALLSVGRKVPYPGRRLYCQAPRLPP